MGETLGESLIDPESEAFAANLSASTTQGKVDPGGGWWGEEGHCQKGRLAIQVTFVLLLLYAAPRIVSLLLEFVEGF